ncbi:MAG: PEP/pyruvate-binding domain-containing protein, partial [Chloroflexi bacterium]|nr:PEP/pyruvate-binding domain-containing protein [Chloroflexota bacterium]
MSDFVYSLERAPEDATIAGGKGAGLARLVRFGVPVPPGFVLTAAAFREYLRANGIEEDLGSIAAGAWPDGMRSQIEAAYEALRASSGDAVAVRSSATVEDSSGASFAGQHATVLNVQTFDDVLDAVLVCWASLYRADALAYRRAQSFRGRAKSFGGRAQEVEDDRPAMAVVVQTLVPAEASGVLFTLDPVSGDRDAVLIDAAFGLGESVVSGAVTPDHFVVAKADGAIRHRQIASKRMQIVADEGGGVRTEEVSDGRASEASLTDEQVIELARLAIRIEEQAGAPQDIEWSVAGGQFYILQARPVTAAAAQPEESEGWVSEFDSETDEATIWTSANIQEVLPGQISPFSCAFNRQMIERFGNEPVERMGIRRQTPD